uniref:Uncharacterized protein n=1 Tax=Theropithecus gelada TaxID=9565 RepID=A0A8D2EBE7_THEGE
VSCLGARDGGSPVTVAMAVAEVSSGPAALSLGWAFSSYWPFQPQLWGLSLGWRLTGFSGRKG